MEYQNYKWGCQCLACAGFKQKGVYRDEHGVAQSLFISLILKINRNQKVSERVKR